MTQLKQINVEKVYPLCKGLSANPCQETLAGELCLPLSKHLKVKMLNWTKELLAAPKPVQ